MEECESLAWNPRLLGTPYRAGGVLGCHPRAPPPRGIWEDSWTSAFEKVETPAQASCPQLRFHQGLKAGTSLTHRGTTFPVQPQLS